MRLMHIKPSSAAAFTLRSNHHRSHSALSLVNLPTSVYALLFLISLVVIFVFSLIAFLHAGDWNSPKPFMMSKYLLKNTPIPPKKAAVSREPCLSRPLYELKDLASLATWCENNPLHVCLSYMQHNRTEYLARLEGEKLTKYVQSLCFTPEQFHEPHSSFPSRSASASASASTSTSNTITAVIPQDPRFLFHVFWRGSLTPAIMACVESYLYTQNLYLTRLILWLQHDPYRSCLAQSTAACNDANISKLSRFNYSIELRPWDPAQVSVDIHKVLGGPGSSSPNIEVPTRVLNLLSARIGGTSGDAVAFSDTVRFVVTSVYGGIYLDADTLLIGDTQPLWNSEFATKWSFLEAYNTAFMNLKRDSPLARWLLVRCADRGFHPQTIRDSISGRSDVGVFHRLPNAFSDPAWLIADGVDAKSSALWKKHGVDSFDDAFKKSVPLNSGRQQFRGAYAYHWHNRWKEMWTEQSYMGQWWARFQLFLEGRCKNDLDECIYTAPSCAKL